MQQRPFLWASGTPWGHNGVKMHFKKTIHVQRVFHANAIHHGFFAQSFFKGYDGSMCWLPKSSLTLGLFFLVGNFDGVMKVFNAKSSSHEISQHFATCVWIGYLLASLYSFVGRQESGSGLKIRSTKFLSIIILHAAISPTLTKMQIVKDHTTSVIKRVWPPLSCHTELTSRSEIKKRNQPSIKLGLNIL